MSSPTVTSPLSLVPVSPPEDVTMQPPPSRPVTLQPPLQQPSAFAPRDEYVKLLFTERPSVDTKLRWSAEVNRVFSLDRQSAEVKMSAVSSRFVYFSRRRRGIVKKIKNGEFLSLRLDEQDLPVRNSKYPSFLLTRYPECVDPSLAKEIPGLYSARRFFQNGEPINRIVIVWCHDDPPPPTISFSFLPCLPPCEVRKLDNGQRTCYRC